MKIHLSHKGHTTCIPIYVVSYVDIGLYILFLVVHLHKDIAVMGQTEVYHSVCV